ncbi:LLM class flavin-dependent oxidoreductase [Nocardiopsis sediminis]|uniref:LLM class flavin-dependent oxidoreductase n=1 Tax=Nocardiopsis sediminis TaxID=1778267 RepID=A0ABV8FXA9_9ACTN
MSPAPRARELHFGLMFWATGTHPAGWRHPDAKADGAYDIGFIQEITRIVERAKFDFLFLGDRLATDPALQTTNPAQMSRLEPFTAASAIAAATSHIGIVVTANPTYHDPYGVARLTAALDHVSGGRASWNLVTGADAAAALNFSRDGHWDTERRYDWADEFVGVVKDLWDSGADDTGGPVPIGHRGRFFSVDGPLDVGRPPQGHVVVLHAGTSDRSRELGARDADVIFAGQPTIDLAKEYYADVKARAARYGRGDADIAILPGLSPVVAPTTEEAVALFDRLNSALAIDPEEEAGEPIRAGGLAEGHKRNLTAASRVFGVDLRGNDLDTPVPAATLGAVSGEGLRRLGEITRLTRRTPGGPAPITYRDLVNAATSNRSSTVVGSTEEVADFIQEWFEERAADGFNVFPEYVPGSVEAFTELVVPELQRRGLFRTEYSGPTFRDHLGLAVPPRRTAVKEAR